jgi:hypothetical protein
MPSPVITAQHLAMIAKVSAGFASCFACWLGLHEAPPFPSSRHSSRVPFVPFEVERSLQSPRFSNNQQLFQLLRAYTLLLKCHKLRLLFSIAVDEATR